MDILLLICGLFCGYSIYAKGVKDGKAFAQGKPVAILPQPVKAIKQAKEEKRDKEKEQEQINYQERLMNYDGFKDSER
jgi:hypothetical protein